MKEVALQHPILFTLAILPPIAGILSIAYAIYCSFKRDCKKAIYSDEEILGI